MAIWSGISLPWMAYGYGLELTPLQILALYNAVANNGKAIRPIIVRSVKRADQEKIVDHFVQFSGIWLQMLGQN